jgi:hypothetical protein
MIHHRRKASLFESASLAALLLLGAPAALAQEAEEIQTEAEAQEADAGNTDDVIVVTVERRAQSPCRIWPAPPTVLRSGEAPERRSASRISLT